jgi:hypothetical protein
VITFSRVIISSIAFCGCHPFRSLQLEVDSRNAIETKDPQSANKRLLVLIHRSVLGWRSRKFTKEKMTALRSIIAKCVLFGCFLVAFVVGQEVVHSESELQAMSDDELEQLCVIRGFELVKDDVDPATGELHKLSHDDFVEAAQRCLAIEQEMYV